MNNSNISIYHKPINIEEIEHLVSSDECGGLAFFIGKVRNNTQNRKVMYLEFEAYEAMAIKEMEKIAGRIALMWSVKEIAIHHRIGKLNIGDTAVAIGVSCPHRRDALQACNYAIDTLKRTVPIWKKEVFEDGEVWVAAHP